MPHVKDRKPLHTAKWSKGYNQHINRARTVAEAFVPLGQTLKQAGLTLSHLIDLLEDGLTVEEAIGALTAAQTFVQRGLTGDEGQARGWLARLLKIVNQSEAEAGRSVIDAPPAPTRAPAKAAAVPPVEDDGEEDPEVEVPTV